MMRRKGFNEGEDMVTPRRQNLLRSPYLGKGVRGIPVELGSDG
jgi:hypothetical protein